MKTIWKYTLNSFDNVITIPKGYRILSLIEQHNKIAMYCLVDSDKEKESIRFLAYGTGWDIPDNCGLEYIGTVSTNYGELVWHIFKQ